MRWAREGGGALVCVDVDGFVGVLEEVVEVDGAGEV